MTDNHHKRAFPLRGDDGCNPGLTKLEYTCIHCRIPETGDPVLDGIIAKAQRRDLAVNFIPPPPSTFLTNFQRQAASEEGLFVADAMLIKMRTHDNIQRSQSPSAEGGKEEL